MVTKTSGGRRLQSWLLLFLWAATCAAGCASSRGVTATPPCPEWSEEAIQDLARAQATGEYPYLEAAIGRQVLHCEAIQELTR